MTGLGRREALRFYCESCPTCEDCEIEAALPDHICGRGAGFLSTRRHNGDYDMTDEEIDEYYFVLHPEEQKPRVSLTNYLMAGGV